MQKRGLIIDGDPAVCGVLGKVLISAGIDAVTLTRSSDAAELLRQERFTAVFLDLYLTAPDSFEIVQQMRHSGWNRTTPIVLMSEDQRPGAMSFGFEAGANFFLYKPIEREALLKLIRVIQGQNEYTRRRTRRVEVKSKVQLRHGSYECQGETVDISPSGILVTADHLFPMGSSVHVSLQLSQRTRPIVGTGSVVRLANGNQMAIQMDRLSVAESERLQEFLLPLVTN